METLSLIPLSNDALLMTRADEIRALIRQTAQNIILIGQKLIDVKNALPHGAFTAWLRREFAWSDRTARNYMNVAQAFKTETVADFDCVPRKVLYALAAADMSDDDRREALLKAKQGVDDRLSAFDNDVFSLLGDVCWHNCREWYDAFNYGGLTAEDWEAFKLDIVFWLNYIRLQNLKGWAEFRDPDGDDDSPFFRQFIAKMIAECKQRSILTSDGKCLSYTEIMKLSYSDYRARLATLRG